MKFLYLILFLFSNATLAQTVEVISCTNSLHKASLPATVFEVEGQKWIATKALDIPDQHIKDFCFSLGKNRINLFFQDFRLGLSVFSPSGAVSLSKSSESNSHLGSFSAQLVVDQSLRHSMPTDLKYSEVRLVDAKDSSRSSFSGEGYFEKGRLSGIATDQLLLIQPSGSPLILRERDLGMSPLPRSSNRLILKSESLKAWMNSKGKINNLSFVASSVLPDGSILDTWMLGSLKIHEVCHSFDRNTGSNPLPIGGIADYQSSLSKKMDPPGGLTPLDSPRRWPRPGVFPNDPRGTPNNRTIQRPVKPGLESIQGGVEPVGIGGGRVQFSNCSLFEAKESNPIQIQLAYRKASNGFVARSIYSVQDLLNLQIDGTWKFLRDANNSEVNPGPYNHKAKIALSKINEFYLKYPTSLSSLRKAFLIISLLLGKDKDLVSPMDLKNISIELSNALSFEMETPEIRSGMSSEYGQSVDDLLNAVVALQEKN